MSKSHVIKDPVSGLSYHIKSFKFELKKLDYDVDRKERVFIGILIVPRQDQDVFNEKIFAERARIWPGRFNHFPLLYNHNTRIPLGYAYLSFITCFYTRVDLLQIWELQATGHLIPESQKAREIYARLKKEEKKAIKEISVGYNVIDGRIKIYEISIEGITEEMLGKGKKEEGDINKIT